MTGRFVLLEQPNETQRKSYKNENRCLSPNPLVVMVRPGQEAEVQSGVVVAKLADKDGVELVPPRDSILDSLDGQLTKELDPKLSANFSLKILETSEGSSFRLHFVVSYTAKNVGKCEERIISRPFTVNSNRKKKKKRNKSSPVVMGIKPESGPHDKETEVWIKGLGFDRVGVEFGNQESEIVDAQEILAPKRSELQFNEYVNIKVYNKYGSEHFPADQQPVYEYTVSPEPTVSRQHLTPTNKEDPETNS